MRFDPQRYPSPDLMRSPRVRWVLQYWQAKAAGAIPLRRHIDPIEMKSVLPGLMLLEVVDGRLRYRLVGTAVAADARQDFTGKFLEELTFPNRDFYLESYGIVLRTREPVFGLDHWAYADGRSGIAEFGMFPLSLEGRGVDQLLTIEDTMEGGS